MIIFSFNPTTMFLTSLIIASMKIIEYGCKLFNEHFGRRIFKFKAVKIKQDDIRDLVSEAVEKVVESA
jgi:hypothetical protein